MENKVEHEIIQEMLLFLEKCAIDSVTSLPAMTGYDRNALETMLVNLKSVNAGFDKSDAIIQVKNMMDKYNIQLDELVNQNLKSVSIL